MVISTSCSRASRSTRSLVERLGEARVGDRGREPARRELLGGLRGIRQAACRATGARRASPSRTIRPLPISSGTPTLRHLDADALAARIAEGDRAVVDRRPRSPPCARARPRRPPPSRRSRAGSRDRRRRRSRHGSAPSAPTRPARSMREAHRQVLDRDVVHDLVVGALQEGRIDRAERLEAFGRQAGGEGHARAARRCRRRRCGSGNALPNRSSPVPDGIAAVMATILSSLRASLIRLSANTLV